MQEPPADLPDDELAAGLRTHYGLAVSEVRFLPLGQDASAWVYRVRTGDGASYFLKVRISVANVPGLLVPRYLRDRGVSPVVAPLPTVSGALWATVSNYALILYPFVEGTTGKVGGMVPQQWISYGTILRQIHDTVVSADLAREMRHETFTPAGAGAIVEVERHIDAARLDNAAARDLAAIWHERRDTIAVVLARAEDLGRQLARRTPPLVLCHADIHTNNVMLDTAGQVWIVDWDETVLAPRERDIMFAVGGGISRDLVGRREEELFLQGYGATTIDPLALTYYRYAWAVSDIGAYAEEIVFRPDLGAVTKRAAVGSFLSLFRPGQIVDLALASDVGAA